MGTGGNDRQNPCHRESMDKPKTRYPESVANRLHRPRPCPDCGQKSFPSIRRDEGSQTNPLDPEVNVTWYCPNTICNKNDGFWIEQQ